jgi:hypothetical protein
MDADFEAMVRYRRGMNLHDLMDALIVEGCAPEAAEEAVMRVHNRIRGADRRRGFTNLLFGLLILGIAAVVTVWSILNGVVIALAYSGLLIGGGMFLIGVLQVVRAGKDRELARISPLGPPPDR